jgi:hypothetical protein
VIRRSGGDEVGDRVQYGRMQRLLDLNNVTVERVEVGDIGKLEIL